jgi:hypothetical protein
MLTTPTIRKRRRWLVIGASAGVLLIAMVVFVLAYFQPQKLFIDDRVNEAFPMVSTPATSPPITSPAAASSVPPTVPPTTVAPEPLPQRSGTFISREHGTTGTATVYLLADGRRVLRLEDLHTSNGPALFVYLSANPAHGPNGAFDDAYIDLGGLKGNIGGQNYDIPPDVDLSQYASVVIWCDRFDAAFAAADLDG